MISIVDDDPFVRQATDALVRSLGYRTATFASAGDFLQKAPDGPRTATMTYPIADITCIAPALRAKLKEVGIRTTRRLIERATCPQDRQALANKVDIDAKIVLQIANLADRMRIKGVGQEYAELLRAAGVDTVHELRYRNSANLARKMAAVNAERKLVRVLPSQGMIARWIARARKLPLKITY